MAIKDLKPQSVTDFLHKASSALGVAAGIAYTLSQVPFPTDFHAPSLLIYGTALLGAFGLIGNAAKKKEVPVEDINSGV